MEFSKPTMPELVPDLTLQELERIQGEFELDKEKVKKIGENLMHAFSPKHEGPVKEVGMLPTHVTELPNGTEEGEAWAIDLGGTNLRVCKVVLEGNKKATLEARKFPVSEELKRGTAARLFDYIVDCLDKLMTELKHPRSKVLPLGFTFSFPVEMTAINSGKLIKWTKGYDIKDAVGRDVAKLLNIALENRNLPVRCNALLNDTTGTLVSHAYHTGSCSVGAIFGTGTNGALFGEVELKQSKGTQPMIVNTEWGGFDESSVLRLTDFDKQVDKHSENPKSQLFEKLISGKYLGEITRYILIHLINKNMLFSGYVSSKFDKRYGFDTEFMSNIEMDTSEKMDKIRKILTDELGVNMEGGKQIEHSDLEIVRWACQCVGIRAALLSGIAVGTAVEFTYAPSPISVGIDGSVFLHYPNFKNRVRESLKALGLDKDKVKIGIAEDGSGIGAGICAWVAYQKPEAPGAVGNDEEGEDARIEGSNFNNMYMVLYSPDGRVRVLVMVTRRLWTAAI